MNIVTNSLFRANCSRIVLIATTSPVVDPAGHVHLGHAAVGDLGAELVAARGAGRRGGRRERARRLPRSRRGIDGTKGGLGLNRRTMRCREAPRRSSFGFDARCRPWPRGLCWPRPLSLAGGCKDQAKESATHAVAGRGRAGRRSSPRTSARSSEACREGAAKLAPARRGRGRSEAGRRRRAQGARCACGATSSTSTSPSRRSSRWPTRAASPSATTSRRT